MTIIKLDHPVSHDGKSITELELRRPNVRDHIKLEHKEAAKKREGKVLGDVEKDMSLYASLADVPEEVMSQLDMSDWGKCRRFYLDCIAPSKPSQDKNETS